VTTEEALVNVSDFNYVKPLPRTYMLGDSILKIRGTRTGKGKFRPVSCHEGPDGK
jgi:hypothetical protein